MTYFCLKNNVNVDRRGLPPRALTLMVAEDGREAMKDGSLNPVVELGWRTGAARTGHNECRTGEFKGKLLPKSLFFS